MLRDAGVEAMALAVDLADEDAPERIVAAAVERLGGVHVLVNNAAVNRRMPTLEMDRRPGTGSRGSTCDCRTSSRSRLGDG